MNNKRSPNIQKKVFHLLYISWYLCTVQAQLVVMGPTLYCSVVNIVEFQTKIQYTATNLQQWMVWCNGRQLLRHLSSGGRVTQVTETGQGTMLTRYTDTDSGWHKIHWYDMIHSLMTWYREDGRGPEHEDLKNGLWMSCKISSRRGAGQILVSLRLSIFNN